MRPVVIAGVGMHPFGKFPDKSLRQLAGEAGRLALKDAGLLPQQIRAAFFANAYGGLLTGQESIRGEIVLREVGIAGIPIVNVENACAGGSTALHLAVLAVGSGYCDCALALGAEKMYIGDTKRTLTALATSADVELTSDMGLQFTAIYAMRVQKRLRDGSLTLRHLADVTVKSHHNGSLNPYAQFRQEVTAEEVLASRPIAGPLTLLMCSAISDGAAAAVVCSADAIKRMNVSSSPIRILASQLRSAVFRFANDGERSTAARTVWAAYEQAGTGPGEIDIVECHDATAAGELLYYEDLGFCPLGEAGRLLDEGATSLTGRIPFNPSGGLTSRGHPVGATGLAQIAELTWQLRGQAGARQVRNARIALAQNSGGWLEGDSAVGAAHILAT